MGLPHEVPGPESGARWLLQLCRLKLCQLAIASARAQTSATTDSCRQPTASRPSRGRGARSRVVGDGVGSISSRARRRHQSKNCFTARALAVRVLRLRVPSSPRLPKFRLAAIRLLYHSINASLRRSFRVTGEKRRADLLEAKLTMVFTQQRGGENPVRTAPSAPRPGERNRRQLRRNPLLPVGYSQPEGRLQDKWGVILG